MQTELLALGIDYRHSRPYHPQTCGKVERFHQTMKTFLDKQGPAASIGELQAQVDRFVAYYNEVRPHRAREAQATQGRLRGAGQGKAIRTEDPGRCRRAGPKGSDRQERQGDASPPDAAPPHRRWARPQGQAPSCSWTVLTSGWCLKTASC
jgi:Integrase core domain